MFRKKNPPPQKAPATSEERAEELMDPFRFFFDCSPTPTAIIRKDGIIAYTNHAFHELSGYSATQIEGVMHWKEFVAPEDLDRLASYHNEIVKPGGWAPPVASFGFLAKGAPARPCVLRAHRIHTTTDVIVTLTDNSVQKKLEVLLRTNEERYRKMVNSISVGLFKTKPEPPGKLLWANAALVAMYGCTSLAEFSRKPIQDYYADPGDRERFLQEIAKNGHVRNFEVLHKKADGTPFWVRVTAFPKRRDDDSIEWIEGSTEDINADRSAVIACETGRQYLHEMVDSALGIGLICTDPSGTITLFNRGAENLIGCTSGEVVGKVTPLAFHLEPEVLARSRVLSTDSGRLVTGFEILTFPLNTHTHDEREWTYRKKDGTEIIVHTSISAIRSADGTLRGYLITAKEITEEKRLEEVFRAGALQMSGVIYNLPDATFAIDREGRVIAWNRAMEVITGVRAVDILGKGNFEYSLLFYGTRRPMLIDLISAADEEIMDWGYLAIRRKGIAVSAEAPATGQGNSLRILWSIAAPIFGEDGERAGAIETLADVTERRQREASLEDSVLKFREILDNTGAATAIIGDDDIISFINPEFGRILGYVREEIEGKKKWTEFVVPEDGKRLQAALQAAEIGEDPVRQEIRFIRWDGDVRNGYLTITKIPKTRKLIVALLDITEKIRAEHAVQEANRKLNILNSITRHDILNQLTVLKGNLELAREETSEPRARAILEKELSAAESIQTLISFTRDYQDIGIDPPEWQDLQGTILKSCEGIRLGGISLIVETGGVEVFADRLLSRVFADLVKNAIEHGEKTTKIRLFCEESFEELHVVCEDDGVGIRPEDKEKIFTREYFLQGGLDLYLAREILSITGIGIRETGIFERGAEFEIRIPKGGYRFTPTRHDL